MRKRSRKLSRLEIEDIIEDLKGGKSMKQIAKEHDISDMRVAAIRDAADDVAEMAHIQEMKRAMTLLKDTAAGA